MSKDTPITAISNTVTIQGEARWSSHNEQGIPGHFYDPVSGWRADDPCRAVHEALASTTFKLLYDTFEAGTHLTTPPSDDTQQS
ncbi:hypothetical protein [Asaia krungthepensis]|uniref:Uncharacterized protein n=1 Tax=Asaia krungthepensis NRIC 0535 TaxID=1307925 RepID=A0ABQ0Q4P6_9PROT|nr:hypothetical protein [Asaia krungthepensis]GBQ91314.1 hypothetical protein AA0535_2263 [Asaia krungthepensis NRIC 0535]